MSERSFFQNALSNFTNEVANGGAIRHLTDLGHTVKQISEELSFPAPFSRVQAEVWKRLLETEVILTQEPGGGKQERVSYVREYDKYGRSSFRRVVESTETEARIRWRELKAGGERKGFAPLLQEKIRQNGVDCSYMSCDFGLLSYREPEHFQALLKLLEEEQQEYVTGLPWTVSRIYHRLNPRMTAILLRLHEKGEYRGECFFINSKEKLIIG